MAKDEPINLEAARASITTASVSIKTLRVDNRQLTQSVFRQLPVRELIDWRNLELLGTVWGWVNYTPAGEDARPTQFVTQFGALLARTPVWLHVVQPLTYESDYTSEGRRARIFQTVFFERSGRAGVRSGTPEIEAYVNRWNGLVEDLRAVEQLYIAT
jgi:hypothetical protein